MFEYLLKTPLKTAKMLEIGNSFDSSSYFAAKTLEMFSPDNFLYCCETWSESEKDLNVWKHSNPFDELAFYGGVLRCLSGFKNIVTFKADLQNNTEMLRDNYFDIVLISGSHGYLNFVKDIMHSIRVLKPNGILIGYHCDNFNHNQFEKLKQEKYFDNEFYASDESSVISILNLLFNGDTTKFIPYATVWTKEIKEDEKCDIRKSLENTTKYEIINKLINLLNKLEENLENTSNAKAIDLVNYRKVFCQNGAMLMRIEKLLLSGNDEVNIRKLKLLAVQTGECNLNLISACEEENEPIVKQLLQKEICLIHSLKDKICGYFT
jgi:SAM-dependent methyltransferase